MRRPSRVGGPADELDAFGHGAVVGVADAHQLFSGVAGGVQHHRHVNVVELAKPDQFRFAAQELDFAFPAQSVPVFDLDVLLGRDSHESDASRQRIQHVRVCESRGRA